MNEDGCETFVSDCHVRAAVELRRSRVCAAAAVVVSALRMGPTRRNVLLDRVAGPSDKVLTESLRRLTMHGLVTRASGELRRDAAVYELTALGASFASGPLAHLAEWAAQNQTELSATS